MWLTPAAVQVDFVILNDLFPQYIHQLETCSIRCEGTQRNAQIKLEGDIEYTETNRQRVKIY
jgi:hypothetical protein